mgnify:CR=1 FL=1
MAYIREMDDGCFLEISFCATREDMRAGVWVVAHGEDGFAGIATIEELIKMRDEIESAIKKICKL